MRELSIPFLAKDDEEEEDYIDFLLPPVLMHPKLLKRLSTVQEGNESPLGGASKNNSTSELVTEPQQPEGCCIIGDNWPLSLLLLILAILCLFSILYFSLSLWSWILFSIIIINYFVEGIECKTSKLLWNLKEHEVTTKSLKKYQSLGPITHWLITCFHTTTTNYKHKPPVDNNSGSLSFRPIPSNGIISHSSEMQITHKVWRDSSPNLYLMIFRFPIVRIGYKVKLSFIGAEEMTASKYLDNKQEFKDKNNLDACCIMKEWQEIEGMPESNMSYRGGMKLWWLSWLIYFISLFLALGWIYRLILWKKAYYLEYTYVKTIYSIDRDIVM